MTEIIHELYYMVDDWASQQYEASEEAKALLVRQSELKEEMALRLGEDGQALLEALSNLNLELEDIHDEALFRAAMQLGTELARPRRRPWTAERLQ